jgi:hypothetical protein
MNYRSLLKPENLFLLIIFFLAFFFFKFSINEVWDFFLVPNNKDLNFSDLRCLQKFDDYNYFFYDSKNLYNIKDRCSYFNYPRLWILVSSFLELKNNFNLYIFFSIQIFAYIGIFFYLIKKFNSFFFLYLFFSGSSLLLIERGNIDLIIFIISFLVLNINYNILIIFLYLLAVLLKLFPFFGILGIFNKLKNFKVNFFILIFSLSYFFISYRDIFSISNNTPKTGDMSYGLLAVKLNLLKKLNLDFNYFYILLTVLFIVLIVYFIFRKYFLQDTDVRYKSSFLFGSLIYLATFVINTHFDYRLVFLFFIIPSVLFFKNKYLKYSILVTTFLSLELNRLIEFFGIIGGFLNNISKVYLFILLSCVILNLINDYVFKNKNGKL